MTDPTPHRRPVDPHGPPIDPPNPHRPPTRPPPVDVPPIHLPPISNHPDPQPDPPPEPAIAPADVPVALLPIGLETRFDGDTLLIRILPDEIHVEDHEAGLTAAEVAVGQQFWTRVWRGGTTEPAASKAEVTAWTALVQSIGDSRRAAWVAERSTPTGGTRPAEPVPESTGLHDPPTFPDPDHRDRAWSEAATSTTLPDRFVALAYRQVGRGGQVGYAPIGVPVVGNPVDDTIQLGFDPTAEAPPVDDNGPALPEGMRWMVDPAVAEAAGLLIRMPLPPGTNRIDRLIVLGVLNATDPATSGARLANVLAGHHYSTGLGIVPVGTASNNTAAQRTGFTRADDPVASFAVERRTPTPPPGSDGALLATALGVPPETLRGVAHSNDAEQEAAAHLNALVWPATIGYWLETLIQPGPADATIDQIRAHCVDFVRGRGPLPAIRVGSQPYGVLPVTSLRRWTPSSEPDGVIEAVRLLRGALPWWVDGIGRAPVVRAGADPDHGTLDMLAQSPVSSSVGIRSMLGANACFVPHPRFFGGKSPAAEAKRQRWLALTAFRALGINGVPYLAQLVAQTTHTTDFRLPYTVDPQRTPADAATDWLAISAYLTGLRGQRTADLQGEDPRTLTSLLTLLARRSVMLERVRSGIRDTGGLIAGALVEAHLRVTDDAVINAQLVSTTATIRIGELRSAAGALLAGSVQDPSGAPLTMAERLDELLVLHPIDPQVHGHYADTVAAAEAAAQLDPDRAALLLGESLDIASHRVDAWVTSLAARRLAELRAAQPVGITLGAYGTVEDLNRLTPPTPVAQPPHGAPSPLVEDPGAGGFVHAPSMAQAATAAVLRAAHLAHTAADPGAAALAIDLSSDRVRLALGLLDGVREGQPLGALLGYRTERMLHEAGAHTAVAPLRVLAPPPVVTATGTPEGLPPTSVIDGLALSRMPLATVLAAVRAGDRGAVQKALTALTDAADAVADLLLAEGVHQIVRGNPERAAAALDTLNRGEGATAEPQVVATPRTGTTLTHRAVVLLGADLTGRPRTGWPLDGVRAQVEPRLEAWVGELLGNPDGLTIDVVDGETVHQIPLSDLKLGALDLVYEPVTNRALRAARARGASDSATTQLNEPRLAAILAMADNIHDLLAQARVGTGEDLARPQDRGGIVNGPPPLTEAPNPESALNTTLPDVDGGDRTNRLSTARDRLKNAVDDLAEFTLDGPSPDESAVASALNALAAFGITLGGDPAQPPTRPALVAVHASAAALLQESLAAPEDPAALFGDGFPVLPLVAPPAATDLAAALATDPVALAPDAVLAPVGGATQAVDTWVEAYGRVRRGVGRLADLLLWTRLRTPGGKGSGPTGAPGGEGVSLRAIQLPSHAFPTAIGPDRGRWVGLPFPAPLTLEPVTSIVAATVGDLDALSGMAVLVLDEFVETVPHEQTTTSVSFGFDAPGARPPQSILLAVPPVPGQAWTYSALAGVVGETLDLAKVRMVDLSSVAWAGRLVPAIYLTDGDVSSGLDVPMRELVKQADLQTRGVVDP